MKKIFATLFSTLLVASIFVGIVSAETSHDKENHPRYHPILMLKGLMSSGISQSGFDSEMIETSIWIQNIDKLTVDEIEVEVQLYRNNGRRMVAKQVKKLDELKPGKKKVISFDWNLYGAPKGKYHPKVFISYNAGLDKPVRFQARSHTWH